MNNTINTMKPHIIELIEKIRDRHHLIHQWLNNYEKTEELPLYSSVDIRNAGFKAAVVDTNIFPAGFNNLCEHGINDSVTFIREAIKKRAPHGQDILIIAEEHTRNTWYLENIRILEKIIKEAGFTVRIATFLTVQPSFCEQASSVDLETATGHPVKIYCLKKILKDKFGDSYIYKTFIIPGNHELGWSDFKNKKLSNNPFLNNC